jgi:hypothetical protein
MNNFIKFSTVIINTSKIKSIQIKEGIYSITLTTNKLDGFMLFTSGYLTSNNYKVEICEKQHPGDYKILTDWINKIN